MAVVRAGSPGLFISARDGTALRSGNQFVEVAGAAGCGKATGYVMEFCREHAFMNWGQREGDISNSGSWSNSGS